MATRPAKVPAIPDPSTASVADVLQALKEWVETREGSRGDGLDKAVTLRTLLDAGLVGPGDMAALGAPDAFPVPPAAMVDPAVPPTPQALTAAGALTTIVLTWSFAQGYSRLAYFEVWRSATDAIGDAGKIAQVYSPIYADAVGEDARFYYWVRAISDAGQSPFNAVAGTVGETAVSAGAVQGAIDTSIDQAFDASGLLDQLTIKTSSDGLVSGYGLASTPSQDNGSATTFAILADRFLVGAPTTAGVSPAVPFMVQTVPTTVNGVVVPKGVYIADAFISNGTITNAKIGRLAVDDAKIASVSVSKITAGQLAVGQYIQSTGFMSGQAGFNINGNGTAEFNNVVVRGTVYANSGSIGGNIIDATGLQSQNYNALDAGWRINSDGTVYFGAGTFRGAVYASSGVFSGELEAATGTFSGELSAATGSFSGAVNVGSFTGYAWPPAGQYGAHLSASGLLVGNARNNRYFQVTGSGDVYAPGFSIVNGKLTIASAAVSDALTVGGASPVIARTYSPSVAVNAGSGRTFSGALGALPSVVAGTSFLAMVSGSLTFWYRSNYYGSSPLSSVNLTLYVAGVVVASVSLGEMHIGDVKKVDFPAVAVPGTSPVVRVDGITFAGGAQGTVYATLNFFSARLL